MQLRGHCVYGKVKKRETLLGPPLKDRSITCEIIVEDTDFLKKETVNDGSNF